MAGRLVSVASRAFAVLRRLVKIFCRFAAAGVAGSIKAADRFAALVLWPVETVC